MPKRIRLGTVTNGTLDSTDATIEIDGDDLYITVEDGDIRTDGTVAFEDATADPSANGELQRNGADLKAFSGGAVRNLTSPTFESVTAEDLTFSGVSEGSTTQLIDALTSDDGGFEARTQQTDGVGTSTTTILGIETGDQYSGITAVLGIDGTDRFYELVHQPRSGSTTVLATSTLNSPAGRTYSISGGSLQLAMASGSYNVAASGMAARRNT